MSDPIPRTLLGKEQRLTAVQISHYQINAGPGGSWVHDWYESARPEYRDYRFHLRAVIADSEGYYYVTIQKADAIEEPSAP